MGWFNGWGLAIMAAVMVPNIGYAATHKGGTDTYRNRAVEALEQIGRYGCMAFMIFNIPYTYFGFWFEYAAAVYLCVNAALCAAYVVFWIKCWDKKGMLRALSLSVIPSCIFVFSGVMLASIPLIVCAVIFAVSHIFISCKNAG